MVRYTRGDSRNGYSVTLMGYDGDWNATDQVPRRAVDDGALDRFGSLDTSDGGDSYRYSGSFDWQRTANNASTRVTAYGIAYDLNLFSNFTYRLDDPDNGDQFHQADHRFVSGGRVSHRRVGQWGSRAYQNTFGLQIRNDAISNVGLYHTVRRERLETVRQDEVLQTSGALYAQNELSWTPWLRTLAGVRVDGYRFDVEAGEPANSGTRLRRAGQPEVRRGDRPVRRHRVLRQRRARLPQQRRARLDHHRRPGDRRGRRPRHPAGPGQGRRGGLPQRAYPEAADDLLVVDAEPRFRAGLHRRRRQHRGRPAVAPLRRSNGPTTTRRSRG